MALVYHSAGFAEPLDSEIRIQLTERGTDVYYLEASLGVTSTELLFDTGSGYLALNEQLMADLEARGLASYQRSIRARFASGRVNEVRIYQIESLHLGNGCTLHNVDAALLKGNTRNILGMNVLKAVDSFNVSFSDSTLTLRGCGKAA